MTDRISHLNLKLAQEFLDHSSDPLSGAQARLFEAAINCDAEGMKLAFNESLPGGKPYLKPDDPSLCNAFFATATAGVRGDISEKMQIRTLEVLTQHAATNVITPEHYGIVLNFIHYQNRPLLQDWLERKRNELKNTPSLEDPSPS